MPGHMSFSWYLRTYSNSRVIWPTYVHLCCAFWIIFVQSTCIDCINACRGHRGRDRMVVGFTTTSAISAYYH